MSDGEASMLRDILREKDEELHTLVAEIERLKLGISKGEYDRKKVAEKVAFEIADYVGKGDAMNAYILDRISQLGWNPDPMQYVLKLVSGSIRSINWEARI